MSSPRSGTGSSSNTVTPPSFRDKDVRYSDESGGLRPTAPLRIVNAGPADNLDHRVPTLPVLPPIMLPGKFDFDSKRWTIDGRINEEDVEAGFATTVGSNVLGNPREPGDR